MDTYLKPHFAGGGRRAGRCRHPYPKRLFETHDVFPLLILDGGAFFFTREHLGGATAAHFIAAFEDGRLLAPWTARGRVHWDKAYDDTIGGPCRPASEKHVWLNRLYFLLPIAQKFLQTRDEKWAKAWLRCFSDWSKAHPRPESGTETEAGSKHCWVDMQVTWRLLVLIHSVYLLEKSRSLGKADWRAVYDAIHEHALHVHGEASRAVAVDKGRGNHFLQKGVALLYAGLLFPEFAESAAFVETGRTVVERQMRTEIREDGGSIEASPSYSHFIARLYLDAFLLLEKNRAAPLKGLKSCVQKQYHFLDAIASPAGRALQLSDSFALDADADLKSVSSLLAFPRAVRTRGVVFRDSCFAVLRSKRAQVFVDGMALGQWHHHAGKPNVLLYLDGRPLVVDSGCSNYDWELREGWLKTAEAHNAVLVSAERDPHDAGLAKDLPVIRLAGFEEGRGRSAAMMVHQFVSGSFRYEWTRTVLLLAGQADIIDRVEASEPVFARQVFHFAPLNVGLSGDRRRATVQCPGANVVIEQAGAGTGAFALEYRPAYDADNAPVWSPQLSSLAYGNDLCFHVRFVWA